MMRDAKREIFNAERFRAQLADNDLIKQLLDLFPEESNRHLEKAHEALKENDAGGLYFEAMAMKGLAGNYLSIRAFAASSDLARVAEEGNLPSTAADDAFAKFEAEFKLLGDALEKFAANMR